jgi:hypothetical protein
MPRGESTQSSTAHRFQIGTRFRNRIRFCSGISKLDLILSLGPWCNWQHTSLVQLRGAGSNTVGVHSIPWFW